MLDIDVVNKNIEELKSYQATMSIAVKGWKDKQREMLAKGYNISTSHKDLQYIFPVVKVSYSENVSKVIEL